VTAALARAAACSAVALALAAAGCAPAVRGTDAARAPAATETIMRTFDDADSGISFEVPDGLEARTLAEEDGRAVFLVAPAEAAAATAIPEANAVARVRGGVRPGGVPPSLPGVASNAHGVRYHLYESVTNEGKPSEWNLVVPGRGHTLALMFSLADSALAKSIAETLRLRAPRRE
jgi:hypothetical protein